MSLLEGTSERSIKEEIIALAGDLAQNQSRLERLVERLEEREKAAENWETRYEESEVSRKEAVNSAKWLRAQNKELEEKLERHGPELDSALAARAGAFRKLKHARKVIRDLLQERGDMASPLARSPGHLTQEDIDQVLLDDYDDSSSSSSGTPDSDRTVRLASNPPSHISSPHLSTISSTQLSPLSPAVIHHSTSEHPTLSPPASESLQSPQTLLQSPNSSRMSPDTWQIHFKKPPGSSVVHEGPITWTNLQSSVGLSEDTMNSLQSLASSPDLSMRLQITRLPDMKANIAFIYDPIFVETQYKSYILDWGRRQTNQNIERYISRHKGMDLVFHMFTFPVKEQNWFYLGAHNWTVVQVKEFWPLEGNSRRKILRKLCQRSRGEVDETEMAKLLDNGELMQFCIELAGVRDPKVSHEFVADVLGRHSTPYSDLRRDRRAEGVKE